MRSLLLVVIVACNSQPSRPPITSNTSAESSDPRAYMLGRGVPRDYRKAGSLYLAQCREGCGDIAACEEYLAMGFAKRGVPINPMMFTVAARLCDRKVPKACITAIYAGTRGEDALAGIPDGGATAVRCQQGDMAACKTEFNIVGMSDSTAYENHRRELTETLCLQGSYVPACVAAMKTGIPRPKEIVARVEAACAEGDVDACDIVPGKAIDERVLCEAGDFKICISLAEAGDTKAAAVACNGGVTEHCNPPVENEGYGILPSLRESCGEGQKESCDLLAKMVPARCP